MRLVIAAPANGAILKDALKAHLQNDPRSAACSIYPRPKGPIRNSRLPRPKKSRQDALTVRC